MTDVWKKDVFMWKNPKTGFCCQEFWLKERYFYTIESRNRVLMSRTLVERKALLYNRILKQDAIVKNRN